MGVNQVILGGVKIIDISDSTITPETVAEGEWGYGADGESFEGTLSTISVLSGTTEPTSDVGEDGDIYIVTE